MLNKATRTKGYGRHHQLVDRYELFISQITMDPFTPLSPIKRLQDSIIGVTHLVSNKKQKRIFWLLIFLLSYVGFFVFIVFILNLAPNIASVSILLIGDCTFEFL